ncbi:hypothetical protein [Oceanicoccus sagamiensis]|uniref:PEP-CTERM protein-sorting domain-containing protein n=1 Tax=Oceanicoccus sagamiensis TaxID=716816 RepID=A0A1X9N7T8_9GAMM|nr:hypothetical protein [Oceanicoccus sagamiensis]ARN73241.1 hypothetical protein BST96_03430 [Oceanicoccus sagamiensis]
MLTIKKYLLAVLVCCSSTLSYSATEISGSIFEVGDTLDGLHIAQLSFTVDPGSIDDVSISFTIDNSSSDTNFSGYMKVFENGDFGTATTSSTPFFGSSVSFDPLAQATYIVAFGRSTFGNSEAEAGYSDSFFASDGESVGWTLTFSDNVENINYLNAPIAVPLPAALPLFFSSLLGLLALRRKSA